MDSKNTRSISVFFLSFKADNDIFQNFQHGSSLKTLEVLPVKMLDFHSAFEKSTYQWKCLHQTLAPVLILSQCFGLIPVYGITGSTPSNLNFKWMSLKVLHTFIILAGIIFCGFGFGIEFIDQGINFFSSSMPSLQNDLKLADVQEPWIPYMIPGSYAPATEL